MTTQPTPTQTANDQNPPTLMQQCEIRHTKVIEHIHGFRYMQAISELEAIIEMVKDA